MTDSTDVTTQAHRGIKTPYGNLLREILADGAAKSNRTGTGTRSVFDRQLYFDLSEDFPLATTKKVRPKSIVHELSWFLRDDSNVRWLQDRGVTIWDEWADDDDDLDPVCGMQWCFWPTPNGYHIDQIAQALGTLKSNPDSHRNIVSARDVSEVSNMALPPCRPLFQFYTADGRPSCRLHQRSADMSLGVSFSIASYVLLTHMMAQQAGLDAGEFIWTGGDCHIYDNHIEQCELQASHEPRLHPTLKLRKVDSISDYAYEDIEIIGYSPHPLIHNRAAV